MHVNYQIHVYIRKYMYIKIQHYSEPMDLITVSFIS